jgi:hypothetical protein
VSGHTPGDQLDLDLPREGACGYALVDFDTGEAYPCDRPGVSWRWYQGHEHEDALDRACVIHENPGGIRMAALVAEVRRLRAQVERLRKDRDTYMVAHAQLWARYNAEVP